MGTRFRKSINLGKYFRINFSKSGVGYSMGTKGFRISKTSNGRTRTTLSVPGTGISNVTETKSTCNSIKTSVSKDSITFWIRALVIILVFVFLLLFLSRCNVFAFFTRTPSISFPSGSTISVRVGEDYIVRVEYTDSVSSPNDIQLIADPSYVRIFSNNTKYDYIEYRIIGLNPGSCNIYAVYGDEQTEHRKVIVSPALPAPSTVPSTSMDTSAAFPESDQSNTTLETDLPVDTTQAVEPIVYYVVNTATKTMHKPGCPYEPTDNRSVYFFRNDAIEAGFIACRHCNP